ncbi:MAG: 50S ribosomal protein L4 [Candidatus Omnitrophica bacterium]|nr:50S ribosomal protein L4 [Candidatus Omnitrophota bacterium]MBI2174058.1 50S ribosomal protein L4 [Candidatus Omnitrophota bacterium]MBI3010673.1 50S ribosomal protein L4 [Candidatus Omnitrophota bacterium]
MPKQQPRKSDTPQAAALAVYNLQGKEVEKITLNPAIWSGRVNTALLVQAVAMYRTNQRIGTAATKTRGNVSGGGKKPWKQKHTGRARAGSTRSPLWRHGGIVFGPHPRNMHYRLPQTMRQRALLESLKGKVQDQELVLIDQLKADTPKTKPFSKLAKTFEVNRKALIVLEQPAEELIKSLRNLPQFSLQQASSLNALDVLNVHKVLLTKAAFERIQIRLGTESGNGNADSH